MGARLTRAKRKISATRIPVRVPGAAELPDRLQTVLGVIHLLFTMGHTAPSGESLMRPDLVDRALHLTRMLREVGADHQARDYDEDEPDCDRDPGQDRCLDQRLVRREDVCSIRLWVANDAHAPIVHDPSCPGISHGPRATPGRAALVAAPPWQICRHARRRQHRELEGWMDHSRWIIASQACAVGVPNPGLIANATAAMSVTAQPSPNAATSSSWRTRRGPRSPGWRSLKHIR